MFLISIGNFEDDTSSKLLETFKLEEVGSFYI